MYIDRLELYKNLEQVRNSKLLVYVTGDKPGMETQIHSEVLDFFADHLDLLNASKKISLYLYSRGGDTLAGWSIVNLIRHFCDEFEVIIPSRAHSTATLISIGANSIVMTKQATLGPIDPSVNSPLNPQIPGAPLNARLPISVEAIAGYFELAKTHLLIKDEQFLSNIFLKLSEQVHPIALGNVYRARTQIQMLAKKLLNFHMTDSIQVDRIISALCSESGSHDYTINRREATNELKLPIEKPTDESYKIIKSIYSDIRTELELNNQFNANILIGSNQAKNYSVTRGLIESVNGKSNRYISEGVLSRTQIQTQMGIVDGINDQRTFEGWKSWKHLLN